MAQLTGGELVVRILKREGVKYLFALTGGHIFPIFDACLDAGIEIIDTRHEQAAAHMAEAWALTTGKAGVCCVTAGPGLTDAVTGVANAAMAGSPMLCIAGHSPVMENDIGPLQDVDQLGLMKPITKWARIVYNTERSAEYTAMAFRHMWSGKPGPVYLEIPQDIIYNRVDEAKVTPPGNYRTETKPAGDPKEVEKAIALLQRAKRPIVIAGSGIWWSQAHKELRAFIERTGLPLLTRNQARGAVPDSHPLCFGPTAAPMALQADVVLTIGIRYNFLLFYGKFPPATKIIQIDIDSSEIGHNRSVDVGIVGDAKLVLQQLTDGWSKRKPTGKSAWVQEIAKTEREWLKNNAPAMHSDNVPIHPQRLTKEIRDFVDRNATLVIDGGDIGIFGAMTFKSYRPGRFLGDHTPLGCLGVGVPFAIAAKLARPKEQVLLLTGDGSFGLNAMEFDTAVRHNIPIVCVIGNDQAWGMIKHGMEKIYGPDRVVAAELGVRRYDRMVQALGAHGELVRKPEEIKPALERAFASGKPACINVLTDPTIGVGLEGL